MSAILFTPITGAGFHNIKFLNNISTNVLHRLRFEASVLWELQAADLSKSSVHKGMIYIF